jgi:hypothetical protein
MIEKDKKEKEEDNIIKIAGKGIEIYNQVILNDFKYNDEVELQVTEGYKYKADYIVREWEALGFLPTNGLPIKFNQKRQDIIKKDKTTFEGIIYYITLKRPFFKYPPEKLVKINLFKEEPKDNIIKVANKDICVYTQWVLNKLQCNNQIELQVKKAYKHNAIDIVKEFGDAGIFPEEGLPIKFETKEVEMEGINKEITKEKVLSITLTKLPGIYKFTKNSS